MNKPNKPRVSGKIAVAAAAFALAGSAMTVRQAGATVVEFSENATLSNHDNIFGTDAFAAEGLHFTGSTQYVVDNRLIGAGGDDKGITTGASSPIMGVTFDAGATSVTFDAVSVNTDFFATAFDAGNAILGTFHTDPAGTNYMTHTFSGVGTIARVEFHDNNNFIAVGRLDYSPVPEPASLGLCGIGLASLAMRRRRH